MATPINQTSDKPVNTVPLIPIQYFPRTDIQACNYNQLQPYYHSLPPITLPPPLAGNEVKQQQQHQNTIDTSSDSAIPFNSTYNDAPLPWFRFADALQPPFQATIPLLSCGSNHVNTPYNLANGNPMQTVFPYPSTALAVPSATYNLQNTLSQAHQQQQPVRSESLPRIHQHPLNPLLPPPKPQRRRNASMYAFCFQLVTAADQFEGSLRSFELMYQLGILV
jgi:hypothetical protein